MKAYYNEIDPFAASWLRELIKAHLIADGDVDERSIEDIKPIELRHYTQCHFFAGIGVWSYALRQAGWPDDRSCPCQPFSAAGKRKGAADERHLWPAFFQLIHECRPGTVFGEQVASKDGLSWLDLVSSDLEGSGYSIGAVDTCAAGCGAPHIRQRLYFVADSATNRRREECSHTGRHAERNTEKGITARFVSSGTNGGVTSSPVVHTQSEQVGVPGRARKPRSSSGVALGDANDTRSQGRELSRATEGGDGSGELTIGAPSHVNEFWSSADWLPCIDGKARPVEPGTFPLAHGIKNRVGKLRGYGNSLVAPVAQGFIEAYLEVESTYDKERINKR